MKLSPERHVTQRQAELLEAGELELVQRTVFTVSPPESGDWWVLDLRPDGGPVLGLNSRNRGNFRGYVRFVPDDIDTPLVLGQIEADMRGPAALVDPPEIIMALVDSVDP